MAYQALYRKWRPQTFDDMVGQSAVTHTLKNAISNQKRVMLTLFTGTLVGQENECREGLCKGH